MKRGFQIGIQFLPLVMLALGCGRGEAPQAASSEANNFQNLVETSVRELELKTETNKAWGQGTFDRWKINQEDGDLVFQNADGSAAVAPAQMIGSFSTKDNSWLWAWDNPSIADHLKRDALKIKAYGERHGIEKLTQRKWTGSEEDAWAMTALAVKLCDAHGAYRGPSGKTFLFMTFGEVKLQAADADN